MSHRTYPLWTEQQAKLLRAPETPIELARWLRYMYEGVITKNDNRVLSGQMLFPTEYGKGVLRGSLTMVQAAEAIAGIIWNPDERAHHTFEASDLDWGYISGSDRRSPLDEQ